MPKGATSTKMPSPEQKRRKLRLSLERALLKPAGVDEGSHPILTFFKSVNELRRFYKLIGKDAAALIRAEIESANAALLKFYLLGKYTPKRTHSVVRESGEVAVVTSEIPGFTPLAKIKCLDLIASGLLDVIVTNQALQGVDPNGFNTGADENGNAAIVDPANLLFPATAEYLGYPAAEVLVTGPNNYLLSTTPKDSCPLISEDIHCLPFLSGQGMQPWNWFNVEDHPEWWGMQFESTVVQHVLKRLLIILILPANTREFAIRSQVSASELNDIYFDYLPKHLQALRNMLLEMEEFRVFLSESGIWESVVEEVRKYNQQFLKDKDAEYRIDLSALESGFNEIRKASVKRETDRTLAEIIQQRKQQFYEQLNREFIIFAQARLPQNVSIVQNNHELFIGSNFLRISEKKQLEIILNSWYQANIIDELVQREDGFSIGKINPHWQRVYNRYSHMTLCDLNIKLFGGEEILISRLDADSLLELGVVFSGDTQQFWSSILEDLVSQELITNLHIEGDSFYFSISALENFSYGFKTLYGIFCQSLINRILGPAAIDIQTYKDPDSRLSTIELLWPTDNSVSADFEVLERNGSIVRYEDSENVECFSVKNLEATLEYLMSVYSVDDSDNNTGDVENRENFSSVYTF